MKSIFARDQNDFLHDQIHFAQPQSGVDPHKTKAEEHSPMTGEPRAAVQRQAIS